jgi:hypothetical protein
MKKSIPLCFLLFFSLVSSRVSAQEWLWANHIGSELFDVAIGTTDKDGNFYTAGGFNGGSCHFTLQTLHRNGNNGMFLAKYDINGHEIWVDQFDYNDFPAGCYDGLGNLIVDDHGNIYITGIFYSTAHFGSITLSANNGDMFLAKFRSDGSCVWATKAGSSEIDGGTGIAIDSLYNVFICGLNRGPASFDTIVVEPGGFFASYDSSGNCKWAKKVVSYNSQFQESEVHFTALKIAKGKLFACGTENKTTFTIDTMVFNHPLYHGNILCCFDLTGNISWAREGLSAATTSGVNLSTDSLDNVFDCGQFKDSIRFGDIVRYTSAGNTDYFIVKYSKYGDLIWVKSIHSGLFATGASISADKGGNSYVTGSFNGITIFGPDTISSETDRDMFLARYNPNGDCIGATHFGNAEGHEIGMDNEGKPMVVGKFTGSVTIGESTFSSIGDADIFVAKYDKITGLEEKKTPNSNQLLIYANPNEGMCFITLPEEFRHEQHLTLSIYNNQGKLIQKTPVEIVGDRVSLNISAESSGMYNVILSNGKKNYSGKVVVK